MRLMEYVSDGAQVILASRDFVLGTMVEAYLKLEACLVWDTHNLPDVSFDMKL